MLPQHERQHCSAIQPAAARHAMTVKEFDRDKFLKVLAYAESNIDGEALNAIRRATKLARASGLSLKEAVEQCGGITGAEEDAAYSDGYSDGHAAGIKEGIRTEGARRDAAEKRAAAARQAAEAEQAARLKAQQPRALAALCLEHPETLTKWEIGFCSS